MGMKLLDALAGGFKGMVAASRKASVPPKPPGPAKPFNQPAAKANPSKTARTRAELAAQANWTAGGDTKQ